MMKRFRYENLDLHLESFISKIHIYIVNFWRTQMTFFVTNDSMRIEISPVIKNAIWYQFVNLVERFQVTFYVEFYADQSV